MPSDGRNGKKEKKICGYGIHTFPRSVLWFIILAPKKYNNPHGKGLKSVVVVVVVFASHVHRFAQLSHFSWTRKTNVNEISLAFSNPAILFVFFLVLLSFGRNGGTETHENNKKFREAQRLYFVMFHTSDRKWTS